MTRTHITIAISATIAVAVIAGPVIAMKVSTEDEKETVEQDGDWWGKEFGRSFGKHRGEEMRRIWHLDLTEQQKAVVFLRIGFTVVDIFCRHDEQTGH